jgi:hypothetical protein
MCAGLGFGLQAVRQCDGLRLTLGQEPGVRLAVVADHHRAMPEMNNLHDMRLTADRRHMVVIPPVRCRCRARPDQSGTFLPGVPMHVPSVIRKRSPISFNILRSPCHPPSGRAEDNGPSFERTPRALVR